MNKWTPIQVTSSARLVLLANEREIAVENNVGLYAGKNKCPNYQNGRIYLTTHRLCYVDNVHPRQNSLGLSLSSIKEISYFGGFLRSSAKISITLANGDSYSTKVSSSLPAANGPNPAMSPLDRPPSGAQTTSTPLQSISRLVHQAPAISLIHVTWICPICYYSNNLPSNYVHGVSSLPACLTCGIKASENVIGQAFDESNGSPAHLTPNTTSRSGDLSHSTSHLSKPSSNTCPRCTFANHPSLIYCEMCNARLKPVDLPASNPAGDVINKNDGGSGSANSSEGNIIKLSFRGSGDKTFYSALKKVLANRDLQDISASSPAVSSPSTPKLDLPQQGQLVVEQNAGPAISSSSHLGIHGLQQAGEKERLERQNVLGRSLDDLQNLMASAQQLVKLAEKYKSHLDKSNSYASPSMKALSDSSQALGLTSIVTKDMSKSERVFHAELARELADFLGPGGAGVLAAEGGTMTLFDLFAVYNRARGISLVSPRDLYAACELFEDLQLPVRLRKFRSGLMVVQESYRTAQLVARDLRRWLDSLEPWQAQVGVTAQDVSNKFKWSLTIAQEELFRAEELGVLCRDEHFSGLHFFANRFIE